VSLSPAHRRGRERGRHSSDLTLRPTCSGCSRGALFEPFPSVQFRHPHRRQHIVSPGSDLVTGPLPVRIEHVMGDQSRSFGAEDELVRFPTNAPSRLRRAEICNPRYRSAGEQAGVVFANELVPVQRLRRQLHLHQLHRLAAKCDTISLVIAKPGGLTIPAPGVAAYEVAGGDGGDGNLVPGRLPEDVRRGLADGEVGGPHDRPISKHGPCLLQQPDPSKAGDPLLGPPRPDRLPCSVECSEGPADGVRVGHADDTQPVQHRLIAIGYLNHLPARHLTSSSAPMYAPPAILTSRLSSATALSISAMCTSSFPPVCSQLFTHLLLTSFLSVFPCPLLLLYFPTTLTVLVCGGGWEARFCGSRRGTGKNRA
jgi:hypothetical protein